MTIILTILFLSFTNLLEVKDNSKTDAELIIKLAKSQLNVPYIAGTLDTGLTEECVYNSNGLDCVTFVENTLATAKSLIDNELTENNFEEKIVHYLTNTRYRGGINKGYISRLHYTSDWILDNIERGNFIDITSNIGGIKLDNQINFMSSHPENYKQLQAYPNLINKIKQIEQRLNHSDLFYIPKEQVNQNGIKTGDIICIATNIEGLDYSHLGFALIENDSLKFIHASSEKKKVVISDNLKDYLMSNKKQKGITVLRPILKGIK